MRSAAVTVRTATSGTSFQTKSLSPQSVKECEPTRWTQQTLKPFGREVKNSSESRFNDYSASFHKELGKSPKLVSKPKGKTQMTKQPKLGGTFTLLRTAT